MVEDKTTFEYYLEMALGPRLNTNSSNNHKILELIIDDYLATKGTDKKIELDLEEEIRSAVDSGFIEEKEIYEIDRMSDERLNELVFELVPKYKRAGWSDIIVKNNKMIFIP